MTMYTKISNYISFKIVFRKLKLILSWPLQYLKKISKDSPDLDKETWGIILRTSQAYCPIKKNKSWKKLHLQGIKVITPRLTVKDALNIYGTSYLPMLSPVDPIFGKLVRLAHLNYTAASHPVHLGQAVFVDYPSK